MPICYVTVSEKCPDINKKQMSELRKIIAAELTSNSRKLDEKHIAMRKQYADRETMLGDIEIDIFSQLYIRRYFSRDKRANQISRNISRYLNCGCATWINMGVVGYSRCDKKGNNYYSDSDNKLIRLLQKMRGIASDNSGLHQNYGITRDILTSLRDLSCFRRR